MRQTFYHTCPDCNAHLDPSESCDCSDAAKEFKARNPIYACTVEPETSGADRKVISGLADMRTYKPLIRLSR